MTLKNEIFEGIAAYKALTPTTQDRYYNEMYDQAKRQRDKEDKADADEVKEAEQRRAGIQQTALPPPPTVATTRMQGPIPAPNLPSGASSFTGALYPEVPPTYRRGGNVNVRRFAYGGPVHSDRDPDNPVDDIILAQLSTDPKSDLGPYAPRRRAPPSVDAEREERIAAERAPNTRARQGVLPVAPPPVRAPSFEGSPVIDPETEARIAAEQQPNQPPRQTRPPSFEGSPVIPPSPPERRPVDVGITPDEVVPGQKAAGVLAGQRNATPIPAPPQALATVPPTGAPPVGAASAAQAPRPPDTGFEGSPVIPPQPPQPPPAAVNANPSRGPVPSMAGPPVIRPGAPPAPPGGPVSRPAGGPVSPGGEPTDDLPPDPGANAGSSKIGRTISRAIGTPEQRAIQKEIWDLQGERDNLEAGWFKVTTVGERAQIRRQQAALNLRIEELKKQQAASGVEATAPDTQEAAVAPGQAAPAQPGQTIPGKAPPPPAAAAPQQPALQTGPPGMGPSLQQMVANREINQRIIPPNQVPPKTAPQQNGPNTGGSTGPGGGQGAQPAPPAGARPGGPASQPYTTQTAPKGSLGDQSRTAAFDPTKDLYDSRNAGQVNEDYTSRTASGMPTQLQPQDVQTTMSGIAQTMPNGPQVPGEGAASRPVYQRFVQAHNPGGKLEPGEAALVGMVGRYKLMLRQGKMKEASAMAMGIMQAASLEAAVRGRHATDLFKSGNTQEAQKVTMDALSQVPDGRSHTLNPDGSVSTRDPNTGQVYGTQQLTGQQWLALAMGLSDGSMVWAALQASAAAGKEPDKDAANRALRGQLLQEQIIGARQRNARGGGGGGRGGKSGPQRSAEADAILGEYAPKVEAPPPSSAGSPNYLSVDYVPEGNA